MPHWSSGEWCIERPFHNRLCPSAIQSNRATLSWLGPRHRESWLLGVQLQHGSNFQKLMKYLQVREPLLSPHCLKHNAQRFLFTENTLQCSCALQWLVNAPEEEQVVYFPIIQFLTFSLVVGRELLWSRGGIQGVALLFTRRGRMSSLATAHNNTESTVTFCTIPFHWQRPEPTATNARTLLGKC